jgi:glutaredoxin-like protein nrdH
MRLSTFAGAVDICATAIRIIGLGPGCHGITQVLTKLKEHLKMKNIAVYGKPNCPNCDKVKKWLSEHEIQFDYYDVTLDAAALNRIKVEGYQQLPVVSINDFEDSFSGFNPAGLVRLTWEE